MTVSLTSRRVFGMFLLVAAMCLPHSFVAAAGEAPTLQEADAFYQQQQWGKAVDAYRQLLPALAGKDAVTTRLHLAFSLQSTNDYAGALNEYTLVLAAQAAEAAQKLEARKNLPRVYEGLKDWEKAIAAWEGLAEEQVDAMYAADVLRRAGDLLCEQGQYARAVDDYQRILMLNAGWLRLSKAQSRLDEVTALREGDPAFWIDPYIIRVTPTSARMLWWSRGEKTPTGEVAVDAGGKARTFQPVRSQLQREPGYYQHAVTLEGLQPYTEYAYTVRCGDSARKGSFKTALPATDTGTPFTFGVYGDTQDQPIYHTQVAREMAKAKPDFVLHAGDLVGDGGRWGMWKTEYFDPAKPLVQHAPLFPAGGNHDGSIFFYSLFLDGSIKPYYDVRYGNTHIFVLDSYSGGGLNSARRNAQVRWLEDRLQQSDALWKIAVTHYVMVDPVQEHWTNWGRDDFYPLFVKYGVDLFFNGHIHDYRRLRQFGEPGTKPFFEIITGGGASAGGDTGKGGKGLATEPSPLTVVGQQALHYCLLTITGNHLEMQVLQRDGSVIDHLELMKKDGAFQEDIMNNTVTMSRAVQLVRHYSDLGGGIPRRIPVDVTKRERPDDPLEVTFSIPALPDGVTPHVETAKGSPWTVKEMLYTAGERTVTVKFTPPDKHAIGNNAFLPALSITYNLKADGQLLEPDAFTLYPAKKTNPIAAKEAP